MRHFLGLGAVAAFVMLGISARALGGDTPVPHPRLDGAWTLNRQMGDQTRRGGGDVGPGEDRGGGGHSHGGFGMGPGGGRGMGGGMRPMGEGAMPDREEMERRRALVRELLEPSPRLTITTDGDLVAFTDADGRVRKYTANGKKEKHQFDNGTVETKTKWDADHLVVETSLRGGMKVTETYALAADTRQLIVQTKMDGGQMRGDDRPPITHYYDDINAAQ